MLLLASLLLSLDRLPLPDPAESWIVLRSRHFLLISSVGTFRTRAVAGDLESLTAALTALTPHFRAADGAPTRVFLFAREKESRPYFDMLLDRRDTTVTGLYVTQQDGGTMLLSAGGAQDDRTPLHELVHYLIGNSRPRPPLWLEEGLAEYFSNAVVRGDSSESSVMTRRYIDQLRKHGPLPLQELFGVRRDAETYELAGGQPLFYAQSWAAVDWLMRNGGRNQAGFYAFLHDVEQGVSVETALQTHYHCSVEDMDRGVRAALLHRPELARGLHLPRVDATVTVEPLDRAGILYELGRFLGGIGAMKGQSRRCD